MDAQMMVKFDREYDLGRGWFVVGFWPRQGSNATVLLRHLDMLVRCELDMVKATIPNKFGCPSTGPRVERLVLAISCEMSSSSFAFVE